MKLTNHSAHPKVSIIIAAYNTERYIGRAVQSALDQTEQDLEIIIVDDGSSDDTLKIARSFVDDRIKVISSPRNLGPSHARNLALQEASGDWITVLDSDDWYAPERIERLLAVAQTENVDLLADDLYMIQDQDAEPWGTLFSQFKASVKEPRAVSPVEFVESHLPGARNLKLGTTKPLIRRDFLQRHGIEYDETLYCGEDFGFYLMCLVNGARLMIIPEAYYFYRSRPGSIVSEGRQGNMEQLRKGNITLLEHERVKDDTKLTLILSKRLLHLEQRIVSYRILQTLKEKAYSKAFFDVVNNPGNLVSLAATMPYTFKDHFHRYVRKIKSSLRTH